MQDLCHGEVCLTDTTSLNDWNAMVRAFLAHGSATPVHLGAVIAAAPQFAMAQAVRGLFCLLLGRREMVATAAEALALAHAGDAPSVRERAFVDALSLWMAGRATGAIAQMEAVLRANPADTLAMKISQAIRFVMGDGAGMRRSVERVLVAHEDHPLRGFALGCHAFALEESGEFDAAEAAGLEGLRHATDDAWGLHAVAHVYDTVGKTEAGIRLIEDNSGSWMGCNNFRYHVWWHKALLHLDRGEVATVLEIYDARIRTDKTDDYRDIANAASLLMRLSLDGVSVGNRWDELADLAENRVDDACLAFADLHYLLALMGGARDGAITKLMARLDATAAADPVAEFDKVMAHPGRAVAAGLAAFAEGDFTASFAGLTAARPVLQSIGGSHTQRDVFERLTIDAGIRAGRFDQAENLLINRVARRGSHEDRFTALRREAIAAARQDPYVLAAQ